MNRITIPIVAVAVFMAACGSAATLSSSSAKDRPAAVGAVQLNGGANAGSTSDMTTRPNAPVHKVGTGVVKPVTPSSNAVPATVVPAFGSVVDRCGMAIDPGVAGKRGTPRFETHLPKLMCAVE
jgi:hypothetical protein